MDRRSGSGGLGQQQQQPSKAQLARSFGQKSQLTRKQEELFAQLQKAEEAAFNDTDSLSLPKENDSKTVLGSYATLLPEKPIETLGAFYGWYTDLMKKTADPTVAESQKLPAWTPLLSVVSGEDDTYRFDGTDDEDDENDDDLGSFMAASLDSADAGGRAGEEDARVLREYVERLQCTKEEVEKWRGMVTDVAQRSSSVATNVHEIHEQAARLATQRNRSEMLTEALEKRLWHFDQLHMLSKRMSSRSSLAGTPVAPSTLEEIDRCIEFLAAHKNYRDADKYLTQFVQLQTAALGTVKDHVIALLRGCTTTIQQQLALKRKVAEDTNAKQGQQQSGTTNNPTAGKLPVGVSNADGLDTDPIYLQFRVLATQLRSSIQELEKRVFLFGNKALSLSTAGSYGSMLSECHSAYFHQRVLLLNPPLTQYLEIVGSRDVGLPEVTRECCAYIAKVCKLEATLYSSFFGTQSPLFPKLIEAAAASLQDTLRPLLLREKSTDALCLTCGFLKQYNDDAAEFNAEKNKTSSNPELAGFHEVLNTLMREGQERLTFLGQRAIREDIVAFTPTDADLDYPAKLAPSLPSADNTTADVSDSDDDVVGVMEAMQKLFACWYPTLQRTLTLLSKLYMTVDTRVFEGLAQEAIEACIDSLFKASAMLTQRKDALDGQLFLIRHLLTLREQIAPFEVSFTKVTVALDFSHLRTEMRRALGGGFSSFFSLENFAPRLTTESVDSKKRLDQELTASIESFIVSWTKTFLRPLLSFLVQVSSFEAVQATAAEPLALNSQNWATEQAFGDVSKYVRKCVGTDLPPLVVKVLAYLPPDQASALLFPIRDNIVDSWERFTTILQSTYPSSPLLEKEGQSSIQSLLATAFQPLTDILSTTSSTESQVTPITLADPEDMDTPIVLATPQ